MKWPNLCKDCLYHYFYNHCKNNNLEKIFTKVPYKNLREENNFLKIECEKIKQINNEMKRKIEEVTEENKELIEKHSARKIKDEEAVLRQMIEDEVKRKKEFGSLKKEVRSKNLLNLI